MGLRPVRVMFFHAYPHQYAGAQRITHMLASSLPERGFLTRVLVPDAGPFVRRIRADGVDVQIVRASRVWTRYGGALESWRAIPALVVLPLYWLRLLRAMRAWKPDVLHVNDHRGMLLAGPAGRLAGVPVLWHLHGAYASRVINRLGGLVANRIVIVSDATLSDMPELGAFARKTEIMHNGLAQPQLSPESRAALPQRSGRPLVVTGARIHPEKGLDTLIRATALLAAMFPNLDVYIAGDIQEGYEWHRRELDSLVAELKLDETVHFLGHLAEPAAAWAAATVYVQPSRAEPFGLAVLEAMHLGVPVVTTRVGGMNEIVQDGVSGLQVSADDPRALADAITRLIEDPPYANRLATAGRRRAESLFSQEAMLDRLEQVYVRLLGSSTRSGCVS